MPEESTSVLPNPCPFCGGRSYTCLDPMWAEHGDPKRESRYVAECMNNECTANGPSRSSERAAAEAWNKSSNGQAVRDIVSWLRSIGDWNDPEMDPYVLQELADMIEAGEHQLADD